MRIFLMILALIISASSLASPANSPIAQTQGFFDYLLSPAENQHLGMNTEAQQKWLSPDLIKLVNQAECDATNASNENNQPHDFVDTMLVLDRWDNPSSCKAINVMRDPKGVKVNVVCNWNKTTNYPGSKIGLITYLRQENQADGTKEWKLTNISHGKQKDGKYTNNKPTKTDLVTRLQIATKQSLNPSLCVPK
jgi:hypothetical protein